MAAGAKGRNKKKSKARKNDLDVPPDKALYLSDPSFEEWMLFILRVSEKTLSDPDIEYKIPWVEIDGNHHEIPEDTFLTREALRLLHPRMPKIWKIADQDKLVNPDEDGASRERFSKRYSSCSDAWDWYTREQDKIRTHIRGGTEANPTKANPKHPYYDADYVRKGRYSFVEILAKQYNQNKEEIFVEFTKSDAFALNLDSAKRFFFKNALLEFPTNETLCQMQKEFDRCIIHVDETRVNDPTRGYLVVLTISKSGAVIGRTQIPHAIPKEI